MKDRPQGDSGAFALTDITTWDPEQCPKLFVDNLERIFNFKMKSIIDTLSRMDFHVIINIRSALIDVAVMKFPAYRDKCAMKRTVMNTATKDIWNLGFSITNGAATRDLNIMFSKDKPAADTDVDEEEVVSKMHEVLLTMSDLVARVTSMELTTEALQSDNAVLRQQVTDLQDIGNNCQQPSYDASDLQPTSSVTSSDPDSNEEPFEQQPQQKRKQRRKKKQQ